MIDATVTGASPERGHLRVRVRCPWCSRVHVHWLLGGHADVQPPSCGTPSQYMIAATAPTQTPRPPWAEEKRGNIHMNTDEVTSCLQELFEIIGDGSGTRQLTLALGQLGDELDDVPAAHDPLEVMWGAVATLREQLELLAEAAAPGWLQAASEREWAAMSVNDGRSLL